MPTNCLNDAWKLVIKSANDGATWRWWRTEVKATSYDSNTPLEELVAIQPIPHGLTPQIWEVLCNYWKSIENLLKEVVDRLLQDKPEETQPLEGHEEAFREVFGPEHSGQMDVMFANIMQQQVPSPAEEDRYRSFPSPESDNN
ncbi:hypothetical protein ZIOFF_009901 [Zingiber officinale]|uniref:Uncharacterized protein n=1 Tax=Zingiber officinale TaxID=94328 RepID=A0A8J5HUP1_ZINOF|nr:hypothetical protein ZIOFF_009901 [Zingiber officinale]